MAQKLDAFRFSLPDNVYSPFIQKAQTLTDNITGGHFYFDNAKRNMYWKRENRIMHRLMLLPE